MTKTKAKQGVNHHSQIQNINTYVSIILKQVTFMAVLK